jgi:hypothetical protein
VTKTRTYLVADHGIFLPIALTLAKYGHRVLYHKLDWQKAYPRAEEGVQGDGFPDIECVPDLFDVLNEVDCFVFPDIYHYGLQKHLRDIGKNVWGSADGMKLEIDRQYFLQTLEELGLSVPECFPIKGLVNLRVFLKDKQDIWIKMSKWRGSFETKHFRNMDSDSGLLDQWAVRFGGLQNVITFLCFPKIDTKLEIGADTFCIDGQFPSTMLHGIEAKDEAYLSAVTRKEDMPQELLPIMEAFSEKLMEAKYRCQWSMEVRVAEDADYFIDPTCRGGLPSTGSQLLALDNLDDIIFYGAQGQLVEPEYNCKFTGEVMTKIHGEVNSWNTMEMVSEIKEHLQISGCCWCNGQPWFPPEPGIIEDEIGWLVATGDTLEEVALKLNELADMLPDGVIASVEDLSSVIKEINSEQEEGINFTDKPVPEPAIVLE